MSDEKKIRFQRRAPAPFGRPTLYREELATRAHNYALLGASDAKIVEFLGITRPTFQLWKKVHPEFATALKEGKVDADAHVARSIYHNARGYSHQAVKIYLNDGAPVYVPYVQHYPPSQAAAAYWLSHRQPDLWREIKAVEMSGPGGGPIDIRVQKIESVIIDAVCEDVIEDASGIPRIETDVV